LQGPCTLVMSAAAYIPASTVQRLTGSLLMIVALGDELVPPELSLDAFSRAREAKKLLMILGDHFSPYSEHFPHISAEATEWFLRHLAVGGARALG
jgi:uncharacterized protein